MTDDAKAFRVADPPDGMAEKIALVPGEGFTRDQEEIAAVVAGALPLPPWTVTVTVGLPWHRRLLRWLARH